MFNRYLKIKYSTPIFPVVLLDSGIMALISSSWLASLKTSSKVLHEINISRSQNLAVAVNEVVILNINWKNYKIKYGDIIEIVQPLKGG